MDAVVHLMPGPADMIRPIHHSRHSFALVTQTSEVGPIVHRHVTRYQIQVLMLFAPPLSKATFSAGTGDGSGWKETPTSLAEVVAAATSVVYKETYESMFRTYPIPS